MRHPSKRHDYQELLSVSKEDHKIGSLCDHYMCLLRRTLPVVDDAHITAKIVILSTNCRPSYRVGTRRALSPFRRIDDASAIDSYSLFLFNHRAVCAC